MKPLLFSTIIHFLAIQKTNAHPQPQPQPQIPPPPVPTLAALIPSATTSNSQCTHYTRFTQGMTCASIASRYSISVADLFAMNKALKQPECNNLARVYYVCVHVLDVGAGIASTISYDLNYPTGTAAGSSGTGN
ncbi:hypothetical protein QBC43DRAFT_293861 [Cladorrhinum sp. PSN259]|nr:hypothetical protein QBC43DRAFT_293861 [Cladorrhinum sp. PSN259]